MFKKLSIITVTAAVSLLPAMAIAEESHVWDYRNNAIPNTWEVRGLTTVERSPEGLHISTDVDAHMTTKNTVPFFVDAIRLTVISPKSFEMLLLWEDPKLTSDGYIQLPYVIKADDESQTIDIDLTESPFWNPDTASFGLVFPAGAEILLQQVEFMHWGFFERMWEGVKTFWTFDTFNPHSINFVWGPRLAFNPIAREQMHMDDPPYAITANYLLYGLLLIIAIVCFVVWVKKNRQCRAAVMVFAISFVGLWLLYDLRMGTEILSYVTTDWKTFVLHDRGERSFRQYKNLYDATLMSMDTLRKEKTFLFVGPSATPYYTMTRYLTYPTIPLRPQFTEGVQQNVGLFWKPEDAAVGEDASLVIGGEVFANDTDLIEIYDGETFLIRLFP